MSAPPRQRPLLQSLFDGFVLLALLGLIVFGLYLTGYFDPVKGRYQAVDGDSLRGPEGDIRLNGIDAPEYDQQCTDDRGASYPCGLRALDALQRLTAGREVDCVIRDRDRYGRQVGDCTADGANINAEMVRQGWAIAYRRHSLAYVAEEADARAARRGIWQGFFEPPEHWRASHARSTQGGLDG